MFCPKCGSLMMPKKEDGKKILGCSCGYKNKTIESAKLTEKSEERKEIEVVDSDHETDPLTDEKCEKCGHKRAYTWMIQTRASDEPETRFFKCEKCKHTW